VLKGVSLDIYRGKTNMIIGPSGSGKTVLMRQLIRLEQPDSGELLVNGLDFAKLGGLNLAAMRRTFGMVFQMSALFDSCYRLHPFSSYLNNPLNPQNPLYT